MRQRQALINGVINFNMFLSIETTYFYWTTLGERID
jgi:hypothetical protein